MEIKLSKHQQPWALYNGNCMTALDRRLWTGLDSGGLGPALTPHSASLTSKMAIRLDAYASNTHKLQ